MRPIATTRSAAGITTGRLAVWWVLASEIVIFGGILASYIMHRLAHDSFAEQAAHTNVWIGLFNTFVLLTSSLSAVLAHKAAEVDNDGPKAAKFLMGAMAGGVIFLLGRFYRVKGPGLIIVIPIVQQMVRVDLRTFVLDVPSQDLITRDNVSVKVNAVLMRDVNDHEAADLLRFCVEHGYELRFIEQMPLDAQHGWRRDTMITADEILKRLEAEFDLDPADADTRGSAPAELFHLRGQRLPNGEPATVGVIGSVTRPFCGACDRVRLTADGQIRNCLFAREESDLRTPLREGATDDEIADRWRAAVMAKLPGHGINDPSFLQPARPMSAIGG